MRMPPRVASALLLPGFLSLATPAAASVQADRFAMSCEMTFVCRAVGDDSTPCKQEIGGDRHFRDRELFILDLANGQAWAPGKPPYRLEAADGVYRLTRQRRIFFASISRLIDIDSVTGVLSGTTRIVFRDVQPVIEFRSSGSCMPIVIPAPPEEDSAAVGNRNGTLRSLPPDERSTADPSRLNF